MIYQEFVCVLVLEVKTSYFLSDFHLFEIAYSAAELKKSENRTKRANFEPSNQIANKPLPKAALEVV